MNNTEEFQHEALRPSEPSIRVVQILPGKADDDDLIECSLREIPLEESHTCLSYVCGDGSAERKTILVNGRRYGVLPNLWAFLRQAREMRIEEPIWIDAISIDQNNIPERNRQVRQMSDIYRQATHVIVWPGHVDWRNLSVSFEEAEREGFQLHKTHDGPIPVAENPEAMHIMERIAVKRLFYNDLIRQYFERLWIVQEILLSKKRSIILSGRLESWDRFARFMMSFWDNDEKWIRSDQLRQDPENSFITIRHDNMPGVEENVSPPRSLKLLKLSIQPSRKPFTFPELITTSKDSVCSELRDHLYALLGLTENGQDFPVDYDQSKERILLDALEYFVPATGADFAKDFSTPYQYLNVLFGIDIGALCKPCALEGRPSHLNGDKGTEAQSFKISMPDAKKESWPVEFIMCPVQKVSCYLTVDERLSTVHDGSGYCQSCQKGIFNFSGGWPLVSIALFRESPECLWVTVSKGRQPIRYRMHKGVKDVRSKLRFAYNRVSNNGGQVNVRLGGDMPTVSSLYRAAAKGKQMTGSR